MFTGIVEETGRVAEIARGSGTIRLVLAAVVVADGAKVGDSLAVNGCCLTMVKIRRGAGETLIAFDLLEETWQRTTFQYVRLGDAANLERSLAANGRIHGHFVTGHIDGTGKIEVFEQRGADWFLEISAPEEILRYSLKKGSIAIDGISLTVAESGNGRLSVWIIPHTREVTALKKKRVGDWVNLEADTLAKYAEKFTLGRSQSPEAE